MLYGALPQTPLKGYRPLKSPLFLQIFLPKNWGVGFMKIFRKKNLKKQKGFYRAIAL
jgi:hypothetical protein